MLSSLMSPMTKKWLESSVSSAWSNFFGKMAAAFLLLRSFIHKPSVTCEWVSGCDFYSVRGQSVEHLECLGLTLTNYYSGDKPLSEALTAMNNEGVTSIVVVDNHMNVLGNISTVDVKV